MIARLILATVTSHATLSLKRPWPTQAMVPEAPRVDSIPKRPVIALRPAAAAEHCWPPTVSVFLSTSCEHVTTPDCPEHSSTSSFSTPACASQSATPLNTSSVSEPTLRQLSVLRPAVVTVDDAVLETVDDPEEVNEDTTVTDAELVPVDEADELPVREYVLEMVEVADVGEGVDPEVVAVELPEDVPLDTAVVDPELEPVEESVLVCDDTTLADAVVETDDVAEDVTDVVCDVTSHALNVPSRNPDTASLSSFATWAQLVATDSSPSMSHAKSDASVAYGPRYAEIMRLIAGADCVLQDEAAAPTTYWYSPNVLQPKRASCSAPAHTSSSASSAAT